MLRSLTLCALALVLGGCGGGDEERVELKVYVDSMAAIDAMNRQVAGSSVDLDSPSHEITAADLAAARALVGRYLDEVQKQEGVDIAYRELRQAHNSYTRKLEQARELVADSGRELRRERGNVAIGMRHIEKMTRLHYRNLDVLWLRTQQQGDFTLVWPE
jgi:hypothetical protein